VVSGMLALSADSQRLLRRAQENRQITERTVCQE